MYVRGSVPYTYVTAPYFRPVDIYAENTALLPFSAIWNDFYLCIGECFSPGHRKTLGVGMHAKGGGVV